jgi:hypothetical protein
MDPRSDIHRIHGSILLDLQSSNHVLELRSPGNQPIPAESEHVVYRQHCHYVHTSRHLTYVQDCDAVIHGLAGARTTASGFGRLRGILRGAAGEPIELDSHATLLPSTTVSLFSVCQCTSHGHTVVHPGPADNGQHGIIVNGAGPFIPFVWDPHTSLWWLPVADASPEPGI